MKTFSDKPLPKNYGLTLIELLVVLSIIAVLSTVALRSVAQITEEKRYDANIDQLEAVLEAVLGDSETVAFIGDIGRLPVAQGTSVEGQLSELWSGGSLSAYAIETPAGDSEVRLGVGWRGPYLNLGLNRNDLSDGFGEDLVFYEADGDLATDGERIAILESLGADGAADGAGASADVAAVLAAESGAVTVGLSDVEVSITEDIVVTVQNDSGTILQTTGEYILVRAYGANFANDGSGGLETLAQAKFDFNDAVDNPGNATQFSSLSFTLNNLPYGPKVFRAYQLNHTSLPGDTDDLTEEPAVAPTAAQTSPAAYHVLEGRTGTLTLTLLPR